MNECPFLYEGGLGVRPIDIERDISPDEFYIIEVKETGKVYHVDGRSIFEALEKENLTQNTGVIRGPILD